MPAPATPAPPQDPVQAHFAAILQDPSYQKLPPAERGPFLIRQVQALKAAGGVPGDAQQNDQFAGQLAQSGAVKGLASLTPRMRSSPPVKPVGAAASASTTPHALDQVLATPGADTQAALTQYVYGAT